MSFTNKSKNIKKNKTKKNVTMIGGGVFFNNIPRSMIKNISDIVKGDYLIAENDFTIELSGKIQDDKYFHSTGRGFAWGRNYGTTWIAISNINYNKLLSGQKGMELERQLKEKKEAEKLEKEKKEMEMEMEMEMEAEHLNKLQEAEKLERENRISFIKSTMYEVENPDIKIRTPDFSITNPEKIYRLYFPSTPGIKKAIRNEGSQEIYTIDIENPGEIDSNGWFCNGMINEDYYTWITEFEFYKGDKWVIGDYNNMIYASSKEDFEEIYNSYPQKIYDLYDL